MVAHQQYRPRHKLLYQLFLATCRYWMEREEEKQKKTKKNLGLFLLIFPIATNVLRRDCHCSFRSLKVQVASLLPLPLHAVLWVQENWNTREREEWHSPFGRPRLARSFAEKPTGHTLSVCCSWCYFVSLLLLFSPPSKLKKWLHWLTDGLFVLVLSAEATAAAHQLETIVSILFTRDLFSNENRQKNTRNLVYFFFSSPPTGKWLWLTNEPAPLVSSLLYLVRLRLSETPKKDEKKKSGATSSKEWMGARLPLCARTHTNADQKNKKKQTPLPNNEKAKQQSRSRSSPGGAIRNPQKRKTTFGRL